MKGVKLSLLMPVRNEGETLRMTLKMLKATVDVPHEVLVVYDTEDDDSIPIIKEMQRHYPVVRPIHNKRGRGIANAIRSGVAAAAGEYILILVADDIGPVFVLDKMVSLMDQGYDLVSVTRYAQGGRIYGGHFLSRLFSRVANRLFYVLAGSELTDATVGIKMFRQSLLDQIQLESRPIGWVVAFELSIKAQLAGLRMGEIPMVSMNRFYGGESSFTFRPWVREYIKWFLWGWRQLYQTGKRRKTNKYRKR